MDDLCGRAGRGPGHARLLCEASARFVARHAHRREDKIQPPTVTTSLIILTGRDRTHLSSVSSRATGHLSP